MKPKNHDNKYKVTKGVSPAFNIEMNIRVFEKGHSYIATWKYD